MADEVYVYSDPGKSPEAAKPKKPHTILIIIMAIIAIACFVYFIYFSVAVPDDGNSTSDQSSENETNILTYVINDNTYDMPSVPSGYTGPKGLDYIRTNYASQLENAKNLCTSQFKGDWVDTLDAIGCYNMQGFSMVFCGSDVIQGLIKLCYQISGDNGCTDTEIYCAI
jgi:hypothetical protein